MMYICIVENEINYIDFQDEHVKVLKELATLPTRVFNTVRGSYLVKLSGNDIINAGRRLEELGFFNLQKLTENEQALQAIFLRDKIIDKHYRFFNKPENILIYEGGSRSGKTANCVRSAILENLYKKNDYNIIAPSYKMLNLGLFIDAKEFIEENDLDVKVPASASGQIKFPLGGVINFEVVISENEAKRNRNNVIIDESDGIPESIADLVIGRARGRSHIIYNPTKRFWSEKYKTSTNTQLSTYLDNPFLSKSQLEWFERLIKNGKDADLGSPERYAYDVYCLGIYSSLAKNVFQKGCFKHWDKLPDKFDIILSYADPSLGVGADFFAGGLFGIKDKQVYLITSFFSQYETADTYIKTLKKWDAIYNNIEHFIESNGIGKSISEKVRREYDGEIHTVSNQDNKNADIILYSPEAKQTLYDKSTSTIEILKQAYNFPDDEHDDGVDVITRVHKIIQRRFK